MWRCRNIDVNKQDFHSLSFYIFDSVQYYNASQFSNYVYCLLFIYFCMIFDDIT
jgi:hypothetical protein